MKIDALRTCLLLIALPCFFSCTKETVSVRERPEVRTYVLKNPAGEAAGVFTIGSDESGASVVTIEVENKSHRHGTTYQADICLPSSNNCYARLAEINAVTGYGETTGVTEASSGRRLGAAELFGKTGYVVKVTGDNILIASGLIQ